MKQPSKSTLKKKADALFSKYIRSKYGYCQLEGKDKIHCGGCLQTMHIETRGVIRLRFDEMNVLCGCAGHHVWYTHNPNEWREFVMRFYPEKWDYVMAHKNEIRKMTVQSYQELIKRLEAL